MGVIKSNIEEMFNTDEPVESDSPVDILREEMVSVAESIFMRIESIEETLGESYTPSREDIEAMVKDLMPVFTFPTMQEIVKYVLPHIKKPKDGLTKKQVVDLIRQEMVGPKEAMSDDRVRALIQQNLTKEFVGETPESIVAKLNTQKGTLNMTVIKGLVQMIEELKKEIRRKTSAKMGGGGGGSSSGSVGAWNVLTIDGSTTSFSVPTPPTEVLKDGTIFINQNGYTYGAGVLNFVNAPQRQAAWR